MKKFIVTFNTPTLINVFGINHPKYEVYHSKSKDKLMDYLTEVYVERMGFWKLSVENFESYYKDIGNRLKTLIHDFAYTIRENNIELFDGVDTAKIEIFEVKDFEKTYAIFTETKISQSYVVSKTVYDIIINHIDNLRILYNQSEDTNVDYTNEFDWLLCNETVFFSNEILDYNYFDFKTGEIKDVNIIGGSKNTASSLEVSLINHFEFLKV